MNDFTRESYLTSASEMEKLKKLDLKGLKIIKSAIHLSSESIKKQKVEMDVAVKQNYEDLSEQKAQEKNAELKAGYDAFVNKHKKALHSMIDSVYTAYSNGIENNYTVPPTEHMLRLYKCAEIKAPNMSDAEWIMFEKAFAKNYQMLSCFRYLAEQHGKNIILSSTYEELVKDLEDIIQRARDAVDYIDMQDLSPNRYSSLEFYKDFENGEIDALIESINERMFEYAPGKYFSLREELEKAKKKAYDNDNVSLSAEIGVFLSRNKALFDEPDRITEDIYKHGEELIAKANTAKKGEY